MMKNRTVLVTAVLVSALLVGCGSDDDATDGTDEQIDGDVDATDADGQDPDGDDDGGGADDGDADADDASDDGGGEASPLGEVTIDQTQSFPNGVELTVRSLRVEQNAIFVDIEAFNGFDRDVMLAMFSRAAVIDDTGTWYRYEPPEDNTDLEIEPNGTLEGTIAFIGRAGAGVSSVTVQFNHDQDGEPRNPADAGNAVGAIAPSFEFADLPLPNS